MVTTCLKTSSPAECSSNKLEKSDSFRYVMFTVFFYFIYLLNACTPQFTDSINPGLALWACDQCSYTGCQPKKMEPFKVLKILINHLGRDAQLAEAITSRADGDERGNVRVSISAAAHHSIQHQTGGYNSSLWKIPMHVVTAVTYYTVSRTTAVVCWDK
ncbi:uncharacterized protein WM277_017386 isoform 2-T3 [Molossus nigricans]